jgi:hypothetical protein
MRDVLKDKVDKESKETLNYLRSKKINVYDNNIVIKFGEWYHNLIMDHVSLRKRCLELATQVAPEGTDEEAIVKKSEEYYKFILNI